MPADTKHARIKGSLLDAMVSGRFKAGAKLPSESELAREFAVNINTAKKVLAELALAGRVVRVRGKGSFVAGAGSPVRSQRERPAIAVMLNGLDDPFYSKILKSLAAAAAANAMDMLFFDNDRSARSETRNLRRLLKSGIADGCVVIPADLARNARERSFLARVSQMGMPLLLLYPQAEVEGCPSLRADTENGVKEAVRELLASGRRRILLLTHSNLEDLEIQATLRGMRAAGVEPEGENLMTVDVAWFKTGHESADRIAALPSRPDAIYAVSDEMARGLLVRFKELGINVPNDIRLICSGDVEASTGGELKLSALTHPFEAIGAQAMELMTRLLDGNGVPPSTLLPMKLNIRET